MIKWRLHGTANEDLESDFSAFFSKMPPTVFRARIKKNKNSRLQKLTVALFDEIATDDVVFCYQSRKGTLRGLCKVQGKEERPDAEGHRWVRLFPVINFQPPIGVLRLKEENAQAKNAPWFQPGLPRTLYELSEAAVCMLKDLCLQGQPLQFANELNTLLTCCLDSAACRVESTGTGHQ